MSSFLVGSRLTATVNVTDKATAVNVDPATFLFTLRAPTDSAIVTATYAWNGSTWTNSESTIGVPSRSALGVFVLRITIPYDNVAVGGWACGWKSTANGSGLGEGSGEGLFTAQRTAALP